jgi:hypothetical protein
MDQAIEMTGRLLHGVPHLLVAVDIERVRNQVQGMLVVLDFGVEARQVEAVEDVVFVNLAKVLVAAGRQELRRVSLLFFSLPVPSLFPYEKGRLGFSAGIRARLTQSRQ